MKHPLRVLILWIICATPFVQAQQGPPPAAPVTVATVVEAEISGHIELVGRVAPHRRSLVAANGPGRVVDVKFEEGDILSEGSPLLTQNTVVLQFERDAARARCAATQAAWAESSNTLVRAHALHQKGQISDAEFDIAHFAELTLRAQVAETVALLGLADTRLDRTTTLMPFTGTVVRKHAERGEWLMSGGEIAEVIDIANVYILLDLPESRVADIDRDAPVTLWADGANTPFIGKVTAIIPDAHEASHTIPLKINAPNPDGLLVAGMYAQASVSTKDRQLAILVPKDAIIRRGPSSSLFLVEDGKATSVDVQCGAAHHDHIAVTGDLKPGQMVVIRGNERLRPGMSVDVTETLETFARP